MTNDAMINVRLKRLNDLCTDYGLDVLYYTMMSHDVPCLYCNRDYYVLSSHSIADFATAINNFTLGMTEMYKLTISK
jgi:hypothetical protein